MSAVIELQGVHRTFVNGSVETQVLKGIDLTIGRGEYAAIMGRSGSGKSTLMNIMGCLDRPSSGSYRLRGTEVSTLDDDDLSDIRGNTIGFVFQSFHLLRNLRVRDNVSLPMEYQRVGVAERNERAEHLLERVGLSHRLHHIPNQLSGGERQRVAIARALANQPRVILADEPTGNLDGAARDRILELFDELHAQSEITLVLVTHDPLIGTLAKRVITVDDGRIRT